MINSKNLNTQNSTDFFFYVFMGHGQNNVKYKYLI